MSTYRQSDFLSVKMRKIWLKGKSEEMNYTAMFVKRVDFSGTCYLNVAASNAFAVFFNGAMIGCVRRAAKGYSLINTYKLTLSGSDVITVRVSSYRNNSFNFVDEPPFFAAELVAGGTLVAVTRDFEAYEFPYRVQKCERYSFQRNFSEIYNYPCDPYYINIAAYLPDKKADIVEVEGNALITRELPYADFAVWNKLEQLETGEIFYPEKYKDPDTLGIMRKFEDMKSFAYSEMPERLSLLGVKLGYKMKDILGNTYENGYKLFDIKEEKTGFISLSARCYEDTEIVLLFDEILMDDVRNGEDAEYFPEDRLPLVFYRMKTLNVVKFNLKAGEYSDLTTFEPYSFRYIKVCVIKGKAKIENLHVKLLENPEAFRLKFSFGDNDYNALLAAAENTLAQNSVDVLTDCPSRERAGWLCDSYFSSQAESLLTGKNDVEKNFLSNYLIAKEDEHLPHGMFPMCYPADFPDGNYIPNWAMWLVLELESYFARTNDRELVEKFRGKIEELVLFFERYENADGLLEKLDKWVFVEWSRCNALTQDVSYPTNMLYSKMLSCAYSLYGTPEYLKKSEAVKSAIIKQSYDGTFFIDNAKRENGKLIRGDEATETCQYYAFFCGIASKSTFPELYEKMFTLFGPNRDEHIYPEVSPSNAFIGNFLRLDFLAREGNYARVLSECKEYFLYMARRTGTLWENQLPTASCNHGFASYISVWIIRALTGFVGVNEEEKRIILASPIVDMNFSVEIPIGNATLCLERNGAISRSNIPDGYRIKTI